ncbi:MAG: hypothetical protein PHI59_00265 [Candidatus Omnitrophica bacterium]|nr:hypothetical protein [Candidatus Omnitrophota bacterium]
MSNMTQDSGSKKPGMQSLAFMFVGCPIVGWHQKLLVLSLAQGKPLKESVRFGVAAGAATVMNPGGELCKRQDTEDLFAAMTIKTGS